MRRRAHLRHLARGPADEVEADDALALAAQAHELGEAVGRHIRVQRVRHRVGVLMPVHRRHLPTSSSSSIYLSICPSIYASFFFYLLSIYLYLFIYPSIHASTYLY